MQNEVNIMKYFNYIGIALPLLVSFHVSAGSEEAKSSDLEIEGVIMLDLSAMDDAYLKDDIETKTNTELRKARLSFKRKINQDWQAKLQISFDDEDNTSEIGDAYASYSGYDFFDITIGQMKDPFGLEKLTSSKNSTFIERSMASNAFSAGRNKGLMLSKQFDSFTWDFGAYDLDVHEDSDDENAQPYAVSSRFTWAPSISANQSFHLGFSASWRELDESLFEINERTEVHSADKLISSGEIATNSVNLFGLEAAWVNGPLSFQTEYMRADLDAVESSEDAVFDGYYAQVSYFLTGEQRQYKDGIFGKVKPISNNGAWELAMRHSMLSTLEAEEGVKAQTATIGINYYYDKDIKVMANLLNTHLSDQTSSGDTNGNAFSLRLQYAF
jgi:phosphate-selective porin OprO/OprP